MPSSLRALLTVVLPAGAGVLLWCALDVASGPVPAHGVVAVLAAGMLVAELFPIRLPGRAPRITAP